MNKARFCGRDLHVEFAREQRKNHTAPRVPIPQPRPRQASTPPPSPPQPQPLNPRMTDHNELVAYLKQNCSISSDVTRHLIMDKLNVHDNADLEIETSEYKVSLQCPLTTSRLRLPGRSVNCGHAQCFDLEAFLKMNEQRLAWKCPICSVQVEFKQLVVDTLMLDILQSMDSNVQEVAFNEKGEWRRVDIDEYRKKATYKKRFSSSSSSSFLNVRKSFSMQDGTVMILSDEEDDDAYPITVYSNQQQIQREYIDIDLSDEEMMSVANSESGLPLEQIDAPTQVPVLPQAKKTTSVDAVYVCRFCPEGRVCGSKSGLISHEKSCATKHGHVYTRL